MLSCTPCAANIKFTKKFAPAGLTGDRSPFFLITDGAWPAFGDGVNTVKSGTASFPRGDNPSSPNGDKLNLCNPKAGPVGLKSGRKWYVGHLVRQKTPAGVKMTVDSGHDQAIMIN